MQLGVSGALHEGLWLEYRGEDYFQAIDYEQIPFRCRKCHEHGHLIREFPLNRSVEELKGEQAEKKRDTFISPRARQRVYRKRPIKTGATQDNTSNAFEFLETETESEDQNKEQNTSEENKNSTEHATKAVEENIHNVA